MINIGVTKSLEKILQHRLRPMFVSKRKTKGITVDRPSINSSNVKDYFCKKRLTETLLLIRGGEEEKKENGRRRREEEENEEKGRRRRRGGEGEGEERGEGGEEDGEGEEKKNVGVP
ncbi:Hypothetical predicted protein [Octopus vulgaris]|uniref:Uncharacterized protein n=1 Tax=Octopus vulgaris TaxID=6645 RepID=A0AA36FCY7_OCTVU|nr:Hypothetical predicted protein [Octopus vulgaris]